MSDPNNPHIERTDNPDGTCDLSITCGQCGKPITVSDEHGMFCEDRCGYEEAKEASKQLDDFLDQMLDGLD